MARIQGVFCRDRRSCKATRGRRVVSLRLFGDIATSRGLVTHVLPSPQLIERQTHTASMSCRDHGQNGNHAWVGRNKTTMWASQEWRRSGQVSMSGPNRVDHHRPDGDIAMVTTSHSLHLDPQSSSRPLRPRPSTIRTHTVRITAIPFVTQLEIRMILLRIHRA